ncbi:hypothetical protein ASPWEDRAFT_44800 [Aspergillus wentii DTO 134E9]|uniref:TNFR-Cys domain-containing protein n=1 Tax=Aspergillus wentii DTO 134E9 TaxID=1073089 RepID=A0A1L9R7C4_ASPWE|nr:uncharacterized protein ASPWEDRAFT_44800 [Aspergillus wentii DTO 134E9]OJJ30821.1 hypothetical protein ASPWEDRAFT_44800 [Aspergillus wentii DTO 134E9]
MAKLLVLILLTFVFSICSRAQGNSQCAQWCAVNFAPDPGNVCTAPAAHGTGPCYECGPQNTNPDKVLCNKACANIKTDPNNCGSCGNVCPSGNCQNGKCTCVGKTCGTFQQCHTGGCVCFSTTEGIGACGSGVSCGPLKTCQSSSECASGEKCVVQSCCGRNVCHPIQPNCQAATRKRRGGPEYVVRRDSGFSTGERRDLADTSTGEPI